MDVCLFFGDQMKRHLNIDVAMEFAEQAADMEKEEWLVVLYGTTPQVKGYSLFDMSLYSHYALYERLWLAK